MSLSRAFAVAFALLASPSLIPAALAADPGQAFPPARCGRACVSPRAPAIPYPARSPIAPVPVAPAPIAVDHWDTNGFGGCGFFGFHWGGCGAVGSCGLFSGPGACAAPPPCGTCGRPVAFRIAPSPVYIVNQGPKYSGPGFMIPFKTYSPTTDLAAPREFPYISARGPRFVQEPSLPRPSSPPPLGVRG